MKNILVLAPHPDDGELGCGGTIVKYIENGYNVNYIAFSPCKESIPEGFPKDILQNELMSATSKLGIPSDFVKIFDYPVRHFSEYRQSILEELIKIKKNNHFDMVFIPSVNDLHQDHATIAKEALRAFKQTTILCYEMPWNNLEFRSSCLVELNKSHMEKKIAALKCYETQSNIRSYMNEDVILSIARVRGVQITKDYAEAFEVLRFLL